MPISETIQYAIVFALTIIFSVFALTIEKHQILLKITAGICWFIMAVLQYVFGGVAATLTLPLSLLFSVLGFIFFASTILNWSGEKKDSFFREIEG